eukprot:693234-Prymnesium_polylepis.1
MRPLTSSASARLSRSAREDLLLLRGVDLAATPSVGLHLTPLSCAARTTSSQEQPIPSLTSRLLTSSSHLSNSAPLMPGGPSSLAGSHSDGSITGVPAACSSSSSASLHQSS